MMNLPGPLLNLQTRLRRCLFLRGDSYKLQTPNLEEGEAIASRGWYRSKERLASFYRTSIVTFPLSLRVSEIVPLTCSQERHFFPIPHLAFLKLTASSRLLAPPSGSPKCLRFGLWLTLCTLNIDLLSLPKISPRSPGSRWIAVWLQRAKVPR